MLAVHGRPGSVGVLPARAQVPGVHPEVIAGAPGVQARCVPQEEELGHHEGVVLRQLGLGGLGEPARDVALVLPQLGRADGLEALPVGEVRLQVGAVHVDDVHARLVDLQVLLELRGDVDDHLEAWAGQQQWEGRGRLT